MNLFPIELVVSMIARPTNSLSTQPCQLIQLQTSSSSSCHNNRFRQLFLPAMILFLILSGMMILVWSCINWHGWVDNELVGRAIMDTTNSIGNKFIHNKLYLIVIFVGLFVLVILGIMLSACCCKASFRNPLCCPCYLCACCGGLACLECIACGLCAEAV